MWKLQGGSYIPGVSGIGHQVGLAKDVHGSLQGLDKGKESLNKYRSNLQTAGGVGKFLAGKLAGFAGKKGLGMLAKTAFGATPMGMLAGVALPMVLDRAMKHGGGEAMKGLAKKFGFAKAPEIAARGKFGLHTDEYKKLSEAPDKIESELTGASEGEALGGLSLNEMWRNLPGGKESAGGVLRGAREQIFGKSGGTGTGGLGLSSPLTSLTGGSPTLQLPTTPTSIAGMESGLTGLNFAQPESLGNIPSLPSAATDNISQLGDGAVSDMWAGDVDWPEYTGDELGFQLEQPSLQQGGYMQGYQEGGPTKRKTLYDVGRDKDEGIVDYDDDSYKYKRILSIPADQVGEGGGLRYYAGEGISDRLQSSKDQAGFDARQKMAFAPQDSIPFDMISNYLKPEKKGLMKMLGFQMGGMMPGGVSNALPYNIGGSVQQQPMAYQLGGLLKYRRSPMMG